MLAILPIFVLATSTLASAAPHCRLRGRSDAHTRSTSTQKQPTSGGNATVAAAWFEGWSSAFSTNDVSWSKYTHVTYSFAVTAEDGSLDLSGSGDSAGLTTFVQAAHAHNVKALTSIGGWTGSRYWSKNVETPAARSAFVKTITDFVKQYQLDGVDFDWEYPVTGGQTCNLNSPQDTANFLAFVQALRAANPTLIMSAAAGITPWKDSTGSPSTDVSGFARVLDWVAIMNYDEFGQWSASAGPNAALKDECAPADAQQGSAASAVRAWTAAGIPAAQLVLGVASYGHAFNVSEADAFTTDTCAEESELALFPKYSKWDYQPGEAVVQECGQDAPKDLQYRFADLVLAGFLKDDGTVEDKIHARYDECSQTPFVYSEQTQTLVSYDDAESFAAKGSFIKSSGLRGFAMWEASGDHKDILLDSIRSAVAA